MARGIEERHGFAGAFRATGGVWGAMSGPPMSSARIAEETRRFPQQEQNDEHEAQQERRLGAERGGHDRVDEPEHEPAEDGARDAPEPAEDDDDEGLQERLFAHHRVELE